MKEGVAETIFNNTCKIRLPFYMADIDNSNLINFSKATSVLSQDIKIESAHKSRLLPPYLFHQDLNKQPQ